MHDLAGGAARLKRDLARRHPSGDLLEAVPDLAYCGLERKHAEKLHRFARASPMYHASYREEVSGVPVTVYEGDMNRYWLSSIQHASSRAPFSPTWLLSAYTAVSAARSLGFSEIVDVGSGDGRIAYCARVLDMDSYCIELDPMLVDLQRIISESTGINFGSEPADAAGFDPGNLGLTRPAFFIGGLAQMGGRELADSVVGGISKVPGLRQVSGMVLVGTHSAKYAPEPVAGWGPTVGHHCMRVIETVTLPTAWTFREEQDAPYLYTRFD